jgi:beta-aspartyl-peptidase (threonine type)
MWIIAVHGGAGIWNISINKAYKIAKVLKKALINGGEILDSGGSALDAVETAVRIIESSGELNAGLGSCLNMAGQVEMDAGIMDGFTLKGGAVACIKDIEHPISAARKVMELTDHVLLSGDYATQFALSVGIEPAKNLITPSKIRKYKQLIKELEKQNSKNLNVYKNIRHSLKITNNGETVGAVALDSNGRLAAATSTGGMWLKLPGRIGDTPILGAGTYANKYAAVSATGVGEHIIRVGLALKICDLVEKGIPLQQATNEMIKKITQIAGENTAGVIVIDHHGNYAFNYNTPGMARGILIQNKEPEIMIWKDKINVK